MSAVANSLDQQYEARRARSEKIGIEIRRLRQIVDRLGYARYHRNLPARRMRACIYNVAVKKLDQQIQELQEQCPHYWIRWVHGGQGAGGYVCGDCDAGIN